MNYNKVLQGGHLTRKPELTYLPSQTSVCNFGLANNRKYKDKEETLFLDCVVFGQQAETFHKYLDKGDPVFIEGRLKLDQWKDNEGNNRQKLKVIVERFQFLGKAPDKGGQSNPDYNPEGFTPPDPELRK